MRRYSLHSRPVGGNMTRMFGRRRLAVMSFAGALPPIAVAAQTTTAPAAPPRPNPLVTPTAPAVTSTSTPALGQIDKTKPYFLYFQRNIDIPSAKQLRDTLVKLAESEVENVTLVLNSPGGLVAPTLHLYNLIQSLPFALNTHGEDLVASSATILMLAGDRRTANKRTKFWLHSLSGPLIATMNTPQFEDQMRLFHDQESMFEQIYKTRTKIPDGDLAKLKHETVTYDTETALKLAIIEQVTVLKIPPKAKLVFFD